MKPLKLGLIVAAIDLAIMAIAGLFMLIGNFTEQLWAFIIGVNLYLIPNYPFTSLVQMVWVGEGAMFWIILSLFNLVGYFVAGYVIGYIINKIR